jgi:hydrogenase-4 component F
MQQDYKRLLAYSSIEHMGLIVFSLAFGAFGAMIAMIHMVGHALIKSMLFFGAGNILQRFKSTKFEHVAGVMKKLPYTGALFLAGVFLLLATPPSALFMSEYLLISRAIFVHPYLIALVLLSLAVIAAGFMRAFMPMLFGEPKEGYNPERGEEWGLSHLAMFLHVVIMCALGAALWSAGAYTIFEHIATIII